MEVFSVNRNRMYALLLAALFLFAAAPAMANWVSTDITGLGGTINQIPQAKVVTPATVVSTDFKTGYDVSVPAAVAASGGAVYVTAEAVNNYFTDRNITYTEKQELPLFKISADAESLDVSPNVLLMHALTAFTGKTPADLRGVKVAGSTIF